MHTAFQSCMKTNINSPSASSVTNVGNYLCTCLWAAYTSHSYYLRVEFILVQLRGYYLRVEFILVQLRGYYLRVEFILVQLHGYYLRAVNIQGSIKLVCVNARTCTYQTSLMQLIFPTRKPKLRERKSLGLESDQNPCR